MKLGVKMFVLVLFTSGMPLLFVVNLMYINSKENLLRDTNDKLSVMTQGEVQKVSGILIDLKSDFALMQNEVRQIEEDGGDSLLFEKELDKFVAVKGKNIPEAFIVDRSDPDNPKELAKAIELNDGRVSFSKVFLSDSNSHEVSFYVIGPIDQTDQNMLVWRVKMEMFYAGSNTADFVGSTVETYLVNEDNLLITPSRFIGDKAIFSSVSNPLVNPEMDTTITSSVQSYKDYRGVEVLGISSAIPGVDWSVISEVDKAEVLIPVFELRDFSFTIAIIVIFIIVMISIPFTRAITLPIHRLIAGAKIIGAGNLNYKVATDSKNEIGLLSRSFDKMISDLREVTSTRDELNVEIEERKKAEEQNKLLHIETSKAKDEALRALDELKSTQNQLLHSEKMASLGQLTSGVAHEINNPINFITAGTTALMADLEDVFLLLEKYEQLQKELANPSAFEEIDKLKKEIEIEFLVKNISQTIKDIKMGSDRAANIVAGLRKFSRIDDEGLVLCNIEEGIDETLVMLKNQFKNRIEVIKNYDPNLPEIYCLAGQMNQVFMNLLVNGSQSIEGTGTIEITTTNMEESISISIKDSGKGIPKEKLHQIFDPFFTTKQVGEGTGLGLSISYGIIEKHEGSIEVKSELNKGTEFIIHLPKGNDGESE